MARQIGPNASNHRLSFDSGGLAAKPIAGVTCVTICVPNVNTINWSVVLSVNTSGGGRVFEFDISGNGNPSDLAMYNGIDEHHSTVTCDPSEGWCLLAVTTSTTACVFSKYVYATNTWTTNSTAGTANTAASGAGGSYNLFFTTSANYSNTSQVAATAFWHRVMNPGEVARLARGRWSEFDPDFHVEFPSGGDDPAFTKDVGRHRLKLTTNTGGTRATIADRSSFRFSPSNRRR